MDVYERIDEILKEKGISRRKAAQMAGIPPTTLSGAIYRKTGLSASAISALAQKLGVDASYLLTGEESIKETTTMSAEMHGSVHGTTDRAIIQEAKVSVIADMDRLNHTGAREAAKRVHELTQIEEYRK